MCFPQKIQLHITRQLLMTERSGQPADSQGLTRIASWLIFSKKIEVQCNSEMCSILNLFSAQSAIFPHAPFGATSTTEGVFPSNFTLILLHRFFLYRNPLLLPSLIWNHSLSSRTVFLVWQMTPNPTPSSVPLGLRPSYPATSSHKDLADKYLFCFYQLCTHRGFHLEPSSFQEAARVV